MRFVERDGALEPRLTSLDARVLGLLPDAPGEREQDLYARLRRHSLRYGGEHVSERDLRLILRGFEHLGKAENRGGWWRRASQRADPR